MTTVAVLNQKGGVGKTTVTLGLASAGRQLGLELLVVDADPQASATWTLGVEPSDAYHGLADVMSVGRPGSAVDAIVTTSWSSHIDLLPSQPSLIGIEADTHAALASHRLRNSLHGLTEDYDLVLIDCPPSLGLLTDNALMAADQVVIVVEPSALSVRGLAAVLERIEEVRIGGNPRLDFAGVVINRAPPRSTEADHRIGEVEALVGPDKVWRSFIPQRVIANEALGARLPIHAFGRRSLDVSVALDHICVRLLTRAQHRGPERPAIRMAPPDAAAG